MLAVNHSRQAIIALQEIPLSWQGEFQIFFQNHGYRFFPALYGSAFNGFMGVALAFPTDHFELMEMSVSVPSQRVYKLLKEHESKAKEQKKAAKKTMGHYFRQGVLGVLNMLPFRPLFEPAWNFAAIRSGFLKAPKSNNNKKTPQQFAALRQNRALFLRLKPAGAEDAAAFVVGTYHMPCIFWDVDVMIIHSALVVEALNEFAGETRRVLMGDFNIKPQDEAYRMITNGKLSESVLVRCHGSLSPPSLFVCVHDDLLTHF